jgi:peroxiredoxin
MGMKPNTPCPALDFTATTIEGTSFQLSQYKGQKIYLTFLRNGACALCNLHVHKLLTRFQEFQSLGIQIVCVFESSVEDMAPYVGQQKVPFVLLSDPEGKLYDLYQVESSEERVQEIVKSGLAKDKLKEAEEAGFGHIPQERANFFRFPADFLITESFQLVLAHYTKHVIDHLSIDRILEESLA